MYSRGDIVISDYVNKAKTVCCALINWEEVWQKIRNQQ
jgi:hypothetical protein